MKRNLLLAAAILVLAWSHGTAGAGPAAEFLMLDELGFDATLELRNFSHFHSEAADRAIRDEARLDLDWARRFGENVKASVKLRAQVDDAGLVDDVVIEIPDNRRDRSILDIAECEIAVRAGSARLYVGRRLYAWGSADSYNPTDRLNSHDWLDPVDGHRRDEKLASWSAAVTATLRDVQLEAVWVPFFSPSRLPALDSRWVGLDRKSFEREFPDIADGYDDILELSHAPAPSSNLKHSQVAVRAKTTIRGVDAAVSYYDGYYEFPELDISTLRTFFPRIHVPGLALSTTLGSFELHSETAFRIGGDHSSGTRLETVHGINWFVDPIPRLGIERALVVLEYLRVEQLTSESGFTIDIIGRADPLLQEDGIASRIEIVFSETTSIEIDMLLARTSDPSFYFGPRAIRKVRDDVTIEAGFDTFFGDRTTSLGAWNDNNRFYTTLTWSL